MVWSDGVLDGRIGQPYGSTRAIDGAGNDTTGDGECHNTGGRGNLMDFHAMSMPGTTSTNAAWWFSWTVDSSFELDATSGDFFGIPGTMGVNYMIGIEVNCDGAPSLEMWQNGQPWEREFAWNVDYFIAMYPSGPHAMNAQLWRNDGANNRSQIGGEFSVTSRVVGFRRQLELTLPANLPGLPAELRNNSTLCLYLLAVENDDPNGRVIDGVGMNSLVYTNGACAEAGLDLRGGAIQFINTQPAGKAGGRPTDPGVNDRQTLSNPRRDTVAGVVCTNCPPTGIGIDGLVDPQYRLLSEAGFAGPYVGGSAGTSDFVGESSARTITYGTVGGTNTTALTGPFNHGDLANLYAYGDARYLYLIVTGPGALGWDNEPDRMNVFLAVDIEGRNSNNDSAANTANDRLTNPGALGPTAPAGRLVNFKGWDPDYVIELVWRGVTQGVDTPANLYAATGTLGGWSLASTITYQDIPDTFATAIQPRYSRTFQTYEFAIPWTSLGFASYPAATNRFRLAAYSTADENTGGVSAWDIADSAPGIGQGPTGEGAHERVGDDALDTDDLAAADGLGDFSPFVGRSWGDPGFEPATDNLGFDVDTLEEYFVWSLDIATCATLGDYVWHDADRDGVQDGSETGMPNIVVSLLSNGVTIASVNTDVSGFYLFTNLVPYANYQVQIGGLPPNALVTLPYQGGNTNLDSNIDRGTLRSETLALVSAQTNRSVDAGLFFNLPDIDLEKATNGEDADSPTGPYIAVGSNVTWTYVVRNTGNIGLTNVNVVDSDLGPITNLIGGDLNANQVLETNEIWTYTASALAIAGSYANVGSVTGRSIAAGNPVSDTDPSHYFGSEPDVVIEKATNGDDADTSPGPSIGVGSTVTWTYAVTNTGNVALTNVVVTDDQGATPVYQSGDDGNGLLDVGEVWIYSATGTVTAGAYVNTGLVTAVSLIGQPVSDTDPSHHFGGAGGIRIEKATNGDDADSPTGPFIAVGSNVTWRYVVSNTGNEGITNVVLTDTDLGAIGTLLGGDVNGNSVLDTNEVWTYEATGLAVSGQYSNDSVVTGTTVGTGSPVTDNDPSHYFGSEPDVVIEKATNGDDADTAPGPTLGVGSTVTWTYAVTNTGNVALTNVVVTDDQGATPVYQSGDDGNGLLDVGEVWIYSATGTVTAGAYVNTGSVTAVSLIGQPVSDTDPSHHFGGVGGIRIEKATNGEDADSPAGPFIAVGSNVTWRYVVSNTGNEGITNVVLTDTDLGAIGNLLGGDVNGNSILDTNEVWTYEATGLAVSGQYSNDSVVTGTTVGTGTPVTDNDPSHYFGSEPDVLIEKATNGDDADTAPGPSIGVGSSVTWTYAVTNTGNVALTNVVVTDDQGASPVYQSGDDGNGLLDVGEVWIYSATGTVTAGAYVNTGLVTAVSLIGQPVSDTDPSHHFGGAGGIRIEKATNGEDADSPTGPFIAVGSNVTWRYVVSNTGNEGITNVVLTDTDLGAIGTLLGGDVNGNSVLDTNEVWTYEATGLAVSGQYSNDSVVTGTTVGTGSPVTDNDPSHYFGSEPDVVIEKATNGDDADTAPGPSIGVGQVVTWTYAVTNTGNVALTNVVVTDDQGASPVYQSGDDGNGLLDVGEVWIYSATGTVTAGAYVNTGSVTAVSLIGQPVSDTDPSHHFGGAGGIRIEKATNGEDADSPTGPFIAVGSNVTWRYVVSNTGNEGITNVVLTDTDLGAIGNLLGGDVNGNNVLDTNEVWTYEATGLAVSGQYSNDSVVTGSTVGTGSPVTDNDPSHYFGSEPDVVIEKATNGDDADTAPGPTLGVGQVVTWTYVVTNTGNVALTNVVVTDDQGATPIYQSGDDGNGLLDVGEVWIYSATGTVTAGAYVNTGLVTAVSLIGQPVSDTDPSHHFGGAGGIRIEKATNGEDADSPTGPFIAVGSNVAWRYVVSNTGNEGITNVVLTDTDLGAIGNLLGGDVNGNSVLDTNEVWTYEATGLAVSGQYSNDSVVTGTTVGTGSPVTDNDPSHYFGSEPDVVIEKATNGDDADTTPGPSIGVGSSVTWTYAVTNTGNVALTNVVVTDDQGATPVYQSGDDGNGLLDVGEVWIYSATGTVTAGAYVNTGLVTAVSLIGQPVSDTDPSHHFGGAGGIRIEKATNGEDADSPTGPFIAVGSNVTWRYVVSNTGNEGITNVVLTDTDLGAIGNLLGGDMNGNSVLDTNEVWTYEATGLAVSGQYSNDSVVTGTTVGTGSPVTDNDPSHYFGSEPDVLIEKATNGDDADTAPGPTLGVGQVVTWTYAVTNTGNVALTNVVVTDDQGATPVYQSGDDGNGLLDVGEVWIYSATGTVTAGAYVNTGSVTAVSLIGQPVSDTDPSHHFGGAGGIRIEKATNGEDADSPTGPFIAVGSNVTWRYVVSNTGNEGITNVVLTDTDLGAIGTLLGGDVNGNSVLDTNEVWTYEATGLAVSGQYSNDSVVTGTTVGTGSPVTDNDPSHYFGSEPDVVIEKATNGDDADTAPGPSIGVGQVVTWTYAVTNTGNVALTNVVVTDDQGATPVYQSGDDGNGLLDVGEVWIYSATGTVTAGAYVNTGLVTAVSLIGQPVSDTDPSHHLGVTAGYTLEKETLTQTNRAALVGEVVTFRLTVRNTGDVVLVTVPVEDRYRTNDLSFLSAIPEPDDSDDDGILNWADLGPLVSGVQTSVVVSFTAVGSTEGLLRTNLVVARPTTPPDRDPVPVLTNREPYRISAPGFDLVKTRLSPTNRPAVIGELIEFRIDLTNTGDVLLAATPLYDTYETNYLAFVGATPSPADSDDDGRLDWPDLGPLAPGMSTGVTATFRAVGLPPGITRTNVAVAAPATPPTEPPVDPATNEAPYMIAVVTIGDTVWIDLNGNGQPDEDLTQQGLRDVHVDLFHIVDGVTNYLGSRMTAPESGNEGFYQFTNLPVIGVYVAEVALNDVPSFLTVPTSPLVYQLDTSSVFTNDRVEYADFGFNNLYGTPVELTAFSARSAEGGIQLDWETAWESDTLGFEIHRASGHEGGEPVRVTPALIEGAGSEGGASYAWTDVGTVSGEFYRYWLVEVAVNGDRAWYGPVAIRQDDLDSGRPLATASVEPGGGELVRVTGERLMAAGLPIGQVEAAKLVVVIDGRPVPHLVSADRASMRPEDYLLFYLPASDTARSIRLELGDGESAPALDWWNARPRPGGGDVGYVSVGPDGVVAFAYEPSMVRMLVDGFRDSAIWMVNVTAPESPAVLYGHSIVADGTRDVYAVYLSLGTIAERQHVLAVEQSAVRVLESWTSGDEPGSEQP